MRLSIPDTKITNNGSPVINGSVLFYTIVNNCGIVLVVVFLYTLFRARFNHLPYILRQSIYGLCFGAGAIWSIILHPPVHDIIIDQRIALIVAAGYLSGPFAALLCSMSTLVFQGITTPSLLTAQTAALLCATVLSLPLFHLRRHISTPAVLVIGTLVPALIPFTPFLFVEEGQQPLNLISVIFGSLSTYIYILLAGFLFMLIKHREQIKMELVASEKRYREVFEYLTDVTYRTNADSVCEIISPSVEKVCGFHPDQVIGKTIALLFAHEDHFLDYQSIMKQCGYIRNFETELRKNDGSLFFASIDSQSIHNAEGALLGEEGIIHDISAIKKKEQKTRQHEIELRHTQKMESIGTLAGGIAHDFNNILAAIIGYTEMAQQKTDPESPIGLDIQGIMRSASRAKDLVRHILLFSRRTSYDAGPIEMYLMIKEVVKMIQATLPESITVEQVIKTRNAVVYADPSEIHQVIVNLCANAIEAMSGKNGVLTLQLEKRQLSAEELGSEPEMQPGSFVVLGIRDTGIGILPEHLDRVFDPFFTTKEVGKGSGLGLSVVHGIVKRLGGFTTIKSTPAESTTVKIALPEMVAAENSAPEPDSELPTGTERILFVDDEPIIVDVTKRLLEHLGYHLTTYTSSSEALAVFKNDPQAYDLMITDQKMPGLTGEQLAKSILSVRNDLPIIMCTGFSAEMDAEKAAAIGISAYVLKPIEKKNFAQIVRKILDHRLVPSS